MPRRPRRWLCQALYAANTGELYACQTLPILRNLARKQQRGTYDARPVWQATEFEETRR